MFTGLVECIAEIRATQRKGGLVEISLAVPLDLTDSNVGDSFCVQGACLTAIGFSSGTLQVEVSQETLERTTLGSYTPGRPVNVERALRLSDRLGGRGPFASPTVSAGTWLPATWMGSAGWSPGNRRNRTWN